MLMNIHITAKVLPLIDFGAMSPNPTVESMIKANQIPS
jgi:hypothetical protein